MKEEKVQKYIEDGITYAKQGEAEKSLDCLLSAKELEPVLPADALSTFGEQLLKIKNFNAAFEIFNELKTRFPKLIKGYTGLALTYSAQKDWEQSEQFWALAFEKFPDKAQPFWYIHQAQAYLNNGKIAEAKNNYTHCIERYPHIVHGYTGIAKVAQIEGNWLDALKYWNICFERFPSETKSSWTKEKQTVLIELGKFSEVQQEKLQLYKNSPGEMYANRIIQNGQMPITHQLKYRHIFIVTYGRSGSTLLQGILNTIKGVIIRGENGNIFFDMYQSFNKLHRLKEKHNNSVLPNQSWYGVNFFNSKWLLKNYQNLARAILATNGYPNEAEICFGFKEIRYDRIDGEIEPYLDFLTQLFPNPAFIFLTRNLDDVANSAWWKEINRETVISNLQNTEARFFDYAGKNKNCYHIRYEEIVKNGQELKDLYHFLGADYQPDLINSALSIPHSYSPEQNHVKELFVKSE